MGDGRLHLPPVDYGVDLLDFTNLIFSTISLKNITHIMRNSIHYHHAWTVTHSRELSLVQPFDILHKQCRLQATGYIA